MCSIKGSCLQLLMLWSVCCVYAQDLSNDYFQVAALEVERNGGSTVVNNRLSVSSDGFVWYTTKKCGC